MIIVDFNQIAISNIMAQNLTELSDIRACILNSLRMYNVKYRKKYGSMVIACDGPHCWRKSYFKYYKASRKKGREDSKFDWNIIFDAMNTVTQELIDYMPYKVLKFEGCEADDIIGVLVRETQEFGKHEPVMIISSDHDFKQLQKYDNVAQYSPMQKKPIVADNPHNYLFEHIMKGDSGDGIPNVLSDDDTFITDGKRQTPLRATKIEGWRDAADRLEEVLDTETYRNYQRNKVLIDLTNIPQEIYDNVINTYEQQKPANQMKVLNYLIKKRCNRLIDCCEEFYCGTI